MKKFLTLSLSIALAAICISFQPVTAVAQRAKLIRSSNGVPGRYIVVLSAKTVQRSAVEQTVRNQADYLSAVYGGKVKKVFAAALKGYVIEMSDKAASRLSQDSRVAIVEQDSQVYAAGIQSGTDWGLDRIDQRALPLNSQYDYVTDASNVHAYVIDSGIRTTHVEFGGRATADFDAIGDGQNGNDCMGHGSHVAGIIGAATWGVAKNVNLHAIRVLPCTGSGQMSNLVAGINWVTENHQSPAVANISITASGPSSVLDTAIQNSINAGVTFVVAAGNYNQDACLYSPGRAANAITVGATYNADDKSGYSNWGACVDIWAPGSIITSVGIASDTGTKVMSGTSMASPKVAGVAALYLASHPSASPAAVAQTILSTATKGVVTGIDSASPNRLLYSLLDNAPPAPVAGKVTIVKRVNRRAESIASAEFPYDATNLSTSSFSLQPDAQFSDTDVTSFGSTNKITVSEEQISGWALTSISCTETAASGMTNAANTTVDLPNRKATIIVEEGETVQCTFTSDEIAPTAANAEVSGRVTDTRGRGLRGIQMQLLDANTGIYRYARTNSFGYYRFRDMPLDHLYIVSPRSSKRYNFGEGTYAFTLLDNLAGVNFTASYRK